MNSSIKMMFNKLVLPMLSVLAFGVCNTVEIASKKSRILGIFPHPGMSHFAVFYPIMNELAEKGNDVTVLSYFKNKKEHPNYHHVQLDGMEILTNSFDINMFHPRTFMDNYLEFFELADWGKMKCKTILESSELVEILAEHERDPFDLVIVEIFDSDCMLGVIHVLNLPYIGLSSCALMPWHYDRLGMSDNPSFVPSEFVGYSEIMTFPERFVNWVVTKSLKLLYRLTVEVDDNRQLRGRFGETIPDVNELAKNMKLLLLNQHYSISGPRYVPPSVIEIGGVHIQEEFKPIPKDIREFLDSAVDGVIYISWGSILKLDTLPEEKQNAIINALKKFPHKVLWKWESDNFGLNAPGKILTRKWMPQREILCHPNVKLFFAHGGLLGLTEAVSCGVPIIVTPFYGDQFLNGAAVEHRGIGKVLEYHHITESAVYKAVEHCLSNRTNENLKIVTNSFKNWHSTPLETAIWWITYILNDNDGSSMALAKSAAIELSWLAYNSFDVIFAIFGLITFILICLWISIKKCLCNKIKTQNSRNERKLKTH